MNSSDSFRTESDIDRVTEDRLESVSSLDDLAVVEAPVKKASGLSGFFRKVSLIMYLLRNLTVQLSYYAY